MFLSPKLSVLPHLRHGFLTKEHNIGTRILHEAPNLLRIKILFQADHIIKSDQQHTSIVNVVDENTKGGLIGDALITQTSKLALCVQTGDCGPILIAHKTKPIIAAVHAGWRGAILEKVIENTATQLKQHDDLSNYVAAVGPCLHQESFQTGPVIYNNVANKKYFNAKRYFDFPLFLHDKLAILGFEDIDIIHENTYTNPKLFGFRKRHHDAANTKGRQGNVIMLV